MYRQNLKKQLKKIEEDVSKVQSIEENIAEISEGLLTVVDVVSDLPEIINEEIDTKLKPVVSQVKELDKKISAVKIIKGERGEKGKDGVDGLDGLDGINGKDGSPDTPEQIVQKLESITDDEMKLSISAIKGLPDVGTINDRLNIVGNQVLRLLSRPTGTGTAELPENIVNSVNGQTGDALLTTSDITEGTNEYYTDAKADARITAQKGVVNGIASLGSDGKIPQSQVPAIAFTDVFVVADQTARLALSATVGDVAIQLDNNKSYILAGSDPTDNADWEEIVTGTNVTSVNGETGTVTLDTDDIDEGSTNKYFTGVTTDGTLTGDGQTTPLTVNAVNDSKYAIAVYVATTAALANTPTYDNGTSGVGATLTRTGNGAFPNQDGVAVQVGSKVLVKNQASTIQNGVYVLTQSSAGTPWVLTRDTSSDTTNKLNQQLVIVEVGTTNASNTYRQSTANPVIGTNNIVYTDIAGTVIRQAATGSQAVNQIPLYTSTVRQLTRGSSDFTYNPTSGVFRLRGVDYTYPTSNSAGFLKNNGTGTITFDAIAKSDVTGLQTDLDDLQDQIDTKQDTLIDGSNIKTVNGLPLMGSGNINIPGELLVTFGTPTQSATATGSVTVASNDYDEVNETEVTLGTLGTGGIKYKYYDSRVDSAPSSPTVGINISSLYLNGKIDSSVENVNIIEYSDKSDDFDTNFDENLGYRDTTNVLTYYGQNVVYETVIVQVDIADIGSFELPVIKIGDNYGLFYGQDSNGINSISNLYKLTLTSTTGTYDNTAYSVSEDTVIWNGVPSGLVGSDLYVYNTSDIPTVGQTITVYDDTSTPIFSGEITAVSEITGNLYQMSKRVSPVSSSFRGLIATEDFYSSLVLETDYTIYQRDTFSACYYDEVDADTAVISKYITQTFDFAANDLVIRLSNNSNQFNPQGMLIDSLTSTGFIQDGGTVTLGAKTYTFQNTLTNVDGNVKIGATDNDTLQNLTDAINLTGTAGTQYATAMTIHPTLTASRTSGTIVLSAKVFGTGGNGISCTTTVNGIVLRATGTNNIATVTAGGTIPTTTTLASSLNTAINANTKPNINGLRISNSASSANVNISCTVPGTLGNSFALATTNPTGLSVSGATLTGGDTSGTLGVAGELRLGYIVGSSVEQTFLCIQNSVWKNLSNLTTPYTWTAA